MGKIQLRDFQIVFNSKNGKYGFGSYIKGKCMIALDGQLDLSKVSMKVIGLAQVLWTKSSRVMTFNGLQVNMNGPNGSIGSQTITKTYKDSIEYFKYFKIDYDFMVNSSSQVITKGIHEFPFCFQLPNETIPSSFTAKQGSVKYWIEAKIDKSSSSFSRNHKTKAEFIVEAPIIVQNPMSPLKISGQKNNDIKMDAMITKRTFHPGELISCECIIVNKLSKSVRPRVTLKQTQTFSVRDKHNAKIQVTNKCVIIKGLLVGPGVTDMQTLLVPIPADIPLSIDCPIISVSYELHLTADIPLARDLHIDLPINITKFQLYEYGV